MHRKGSQSEKHIQQVEFALDQAAGLVEHVAEVVHEVLVLERAIVVESCSAGAGRQTDSSCQERWCKQNQKSAQTDRQGEPAPGVECLRIGRRQWGL
jgi:hypothetical protein